MSTYQINLIAALSAVALCAPPSLSAQSSTESQQTQSQPAVASTASATTTNEVKRATDDSDEATAARAKGQPMQSSDGNEVGKIHDFIIDGNSGKIVQVVVSTGGVLGVGDKLRLVPISSVNPSDDGFTADVPQSQFQSMPTITDDDLNAGRFPTPSEMKQRDASSSGQMIAASQLKGKSIRSDDWDVGEIEHVVIDLESGKALALVDVNAAFAGEGGEYLVPFSKLEIRSGETDSITSTLLRSDFSTEQAASAASASTTAPSSTASSSPSGSNQGQTASVSSQNTGATSATASGTSAAAATPSTSAASTTEEGQSGRSEPAQGVAATGSSSSDTAAKSGSGSNTASSTPGAGDPARSSTPSTPATADTANSPSGVVTNTPPPLPADHNERLTPTGRSSAEQVSAAPTTTVMAIRHALDTDPELARENVQVTSKIVLEGSVQTDEAKSRVEELAKEAAGSAKIENQITVEKK